MIAIFKDVSIYSIGEIVTKLIGFSSMIVFTYFLSQEQIGVYGYISIIIGFVNSFLILGMNNAYGRYFFECKNKKEEQVLTSTIFLFLFIWIIISIIPVIYFFKEITVFLLSDELYSIAFLLALFGLPLKLFVMMVNQVLRNQFKTKKFVIYSFFISFISLLTSLALFYFSELEIETIFLAIIVANLMILPIMIYNIKELISFDFDFKLLKKVLSYGIPFLPATIAFYVFSVADRVMLESMSNLKSLGIYTIAVSLSGVMNIFVSAVGQAWSPHAFKLYEDDKLKAKVIYEKFLYILLIIVLVIIFVLTMLGQEIIDVLFPISYSSSYYPMLFLVLGIGFNLTTQVTASGIGLAKKTVYLVYITFVVVVINIMLNYILIPLYNELGASIATCISFLILTILYAFVSQKLFTIKYNIKYLFIFFLILGLIIVASKLSIYFRLLLIAFLLFFIVYNKNKIISKIKKELI